MLSFKANGKTKTLKDEFVDVSLNELSAAYKYVSTISPDLKRYLLKDSKNEVKESELLEFKMHWISLFSNFSVDELRLIPVKNGDLTDISVEWLYNHCEMFMHQPKTYIDLKDFKHKGKKYSLIKPLKTISGAELLFANGNYRQFMLGSQLTSMIENNKKQGGIPSLIQLFALLYSDGNDSGEDVAKRIGFFGEINALYGWSSYFFFVELVEKYKDYFLLSTTKNPPVPIMKEYHIQRLSQLLSRTIFGKLLPSKWLKREFSIMAT